MKCIFMFKCFLNSTHLTSHLLFILQNAERNLNSKISTVEEFVDHLTFLTHISDDIPRLEVQFKEVVRLFGTAFKYHSVLSEEEKALYKTLAPSFLQLKVRRCLED